MKTYRHGRRIFDVDSNQIVSEACYGSINAAKAANRLTKYPLWPKGVPTPPRTEGLAVVGHSAKAR